MDLKELTDEELFNLSQEKKKNGCHTTRANLAYQMYLDRQNSFRNPYALGKNISGQQSYIPYGVNDTEDNR